MSKIGTFLAALALLLPATAGAQDPQDPPPDNSTATARDHLLLLESWSRVIHLEAPGQLAAFEVKLFGMPSADPPRGWTVRCMLALDNYVLESVSDLEPEGLFPLTLFYFQVFLSHAATNQPWLATRARARYVSVLDRYSRRSKPRSEARRRHSQMLVAIAARLSSYSFLALSQMAHSAALDAVALTPRSYAALYWAAFLAEKLGRHEEALDLWVRLVHHHGEDPELLLRRGVNLARQGKTGPARADFESVARGAHDDVWRILAYQELAQLDPKAGDPRAVAVLDEALGVFPDDQGLRLLASFHGLPVDPVLEGDVPPSPRLRYETVREAELAAADKEWIAEVESRLEGLSLTLAKIRGRIESGETEETVFGSCRDAEVELEGIRSLEPLQTSRIPSM